MVTFSDSYMYMYTAHSTIWSYELHCFHAYSKKQQEDDKKLVERNRRELVRLDKQLKVSKAQFTRLQELNLELSWHLEEEMARTGDKEYLMKVFSP